MKHINKTVKDVREGLNNEDEIKLKEQDTGILLHKGTLGELPYLYDEREVSYVSGKNPVVIVVKVREK